MSDTNPRPSSQPTGATPSKEHARHPDADQAEAPRQPSRQAGYPDDEQDRAENARQRRDGDPFDQSDRASDEAVRERAQPGPSHLNDR